MKIHPIIWGGIVATSAVIVISIFLAAQPVCVERDSIEVCQTNVSAFLSSPPNEKGDTLAGLAGTLAFIWIIVTVALQSQELKAQRKELEKSREQSEVMNATMASQLFENTFFELVSTHNSIVDSIDVSYDVPVDWSAQTKTVTKTGRDAFERFYDRLKVYNDPKVDVSDWYSEYWGEVQNDLGHYFRFLYRALKFIHDNTHSKEHHRKLFRALLSDSELAVIFYNCLSYHGENFVKYAVAFEIFDNLPPESLLEWGDWKLMDPSAYGESLEIFES